MRRWEHFPDTVCDREKIKVPPLPRVIVDMVNTNTHVSILCTGERLKHNDGEGTLEINLVSESKFAKLEFSFRWMGVKVIEVVRTLLR